MENQPVLQLLNSVCVGITIGAVLGLIALLIYLQRSQTRLHREMLRRSDDIGLDILRHNTRTDQVLEPGDRGVDHFVDPSKRDA